MTGEGTLKCSCWLTRLRLGPEYKFPTGINDSWDALKWVSESLSPIEISMTLC